ncbi:MULTISPECIES: hypothetical protein [Vibrio]|uniref:hypothetical protein n=1 Tax=Vibrio TaxID=662 RepID=UPI0004865E57|nr:hypothetical protein [Vibrio cholerae]EGQ9395960.1 hypothetical protein [Vibrio cholerae]EGR0683739.1 hypothetical protein [Vibrio cholerae]EGR1311919.1 hypothetical protein [Vibrio cholerae]EGR2428089.1 hypothetical protein [Vibrio cholerae]EHZ6902841.1 hypothetical protein [Vibrio cholerae]
MSQNYIDWDDLSCDWPNATSAIMKHIKDNEPLNSKGTWRFEKGRIAQRRDGYSLYVAHTAFDSSVNSIVRLHVQACVSQMDEIKVKTNKREKIDEE